MDPEEEYNEDDHLHESLLQEMADAELHPWNPPDDWWMSGTGAIEEEADLP